jgi:hypothetical protein
MTRARACGAAPRDARSRVCAARPFGIEIDIAYDGAPLVTRAFDSGEEALDWAEKPK